MLLWIVCACGVGIAICLQGATNGAFGARIGVPAAVAINLATALVVAGVVYWWLPRAAPRDEPTPWWMWLGGAYGLCILAGAAFVFPRLGAGTATALVVAAQLLTALCLDHFGWPGGRVDVTPVRWLGAALLMVGAVLVLWPRLRS